jgi:hypothetical protein
MNTLIKLSDTHYIIVDDSEIKEGDYYFSKTSDGVFIRSIGGHWINEYDKAMYKKITHSTQPLEGVITIPLSEVEEAINGYSVEKIAIKRWGKDLATKGHRIGFIDGFKAHQELTKDKLFTVEELYTAFSCGRTYEKSNHEGVGQSELVDYIQSLRQTEWNVEITPEGKIVLL